jgi:dihydrofolate reductase
LETLTCRGKQDRQAKNAGQSNRRVRYGVAMSLDGFIAGPSGEADWIIMDPEIDFRAIYSQFDTMVMGRRTFEVVKAAGGGGSTPGMQVFVCSRTLRQEDYPDVTIVDNPERLMAELRSKPGKDVWLFGGGSLFRSFAELGLVDTVEVGVIPVLLGAAVPLRPAPAKRVSLKLTGHKLYAKTGIMSLEYAVQYGRGSKRQLRPPPPQAQEE